jgi:hypothetical protein
MNQHDRRPTAMLLVIDTGALCVGKGHRRSLW